MTTDIYVPPPFSQNTSDIINVFTTFASDFDNVISSLMNNVRNTSNGMEPLLNIVIAPVQLVEQISEPFNEISNILSTYATSWTNPNSFLGDILDVYLYMQYVLKTLMIITPEVFIRIVESTFDFSYAMIHRTLDMRILSLPYRSTVTITNTMIGGFNLKALQLGNYQLINMKLIKDGYRTELYTFKDSQIDKFVIFGSITLLFTFSVGLYLNERWRKLPFRIG